MSALYLNRMTWFEIHEHIKNGNVTVIVPLGSTEQHGRQLPLGTDSIIGEELGRRLAERLEAFVTPTLQFGCSEHHLGFAGTLSITEDTFRSIVKDLIQSLSRHGFKRIILLPSHGGNFAPLKQAAMEFGELESVQILAFSDLYGFLKACVSSSEKFGIEPFRSGVHAGEWETSIILYLRREQVKMDQATEGFLGSVNEIRAKTPSGLENLDENGVLGDPRLGTAEAGKTYLEDAVNFYHQWVKNQ